MEPAEDVQLSENVPAASGTFCLDDARDAYKSQAQVEHGSIINPITGEEVDIMQQCVNLQLDTGNQHEVGDMDAYREVVLDFAEELKQGMLAWVCLSNGKYQRGHINRVNAEDKSAVTYDFQYMKTVVEGSKKMDKIFIIKDLSRMQIKTRQLLVKGDPAGGKTTFAKQLLTWIMRSDDMKRLVPVMVRTIDLTRYQRSFSDEDDDIIDQYLAMHYKDSGFYNLFLQARVEGRLLIILDGFDEAGALERRLTNLIKDQLVNECFLVLTSRDMSTTFDGAAFERFRSVRVMELNADQQRQVIERRLSNEDQVKRFCTQLTLNPALSLMARNPLLLNVTLAVFTDSGLHQEEGLNRGKVYSVALDGMLCNIEKAKAAEISAQHEESSHGCTFSAQALRAVLRRMAWLAHTKGGGKGVRDFGIELITQAIASSGVGEEFTMTHWKGIEDIVKKGRLPVLAWFVEEGVDTFRFAHLTFQEFLCAEQCLEKTLEDEDFMNFWRDLVCGSGPSELIRRGWWQQTLQMYCDLATCSGAKTQAGTNLSTALGKCFLRLSEDDEHTLELQQGVDDSNILTIVSMLHMNSVVEKIVLGRKLSSNGISTLHSLKLSSLQHLSLRGNAIGPDGCRVIAHFLEASGAPLQELLLSNNVLCQGAPKENMPPPSDCNPSTGHYDSYMVDLDGFGLLLRAIEKHKCLRSVDFLGNFLNLQAGRMLSDLARKNQNLETICSIPVDKIREQVLRQLQFSNRTFFLQRNQAAEAFFSTGDAELLLELIKEHPQPHLSSLCLDNQALASDTQGVVELFDKLGDVVAAAEQLESLSLVGFWDCGVEAGIRLGRKIRSHQRLLVVHIGTGKIDLAEIRRLASENEVDTALNISNWSNHGIRDCGAGILSECLPPNVCKIDIQGLGVGASGYKVLSRCAQLKDINGFQLNDFTEECNTLDLSQNPTNSSGAVACVIARTVMTPNLQYLDLSGSNLTSKSHVHVLTPVVGGGAAIGCDGGCDCSAFRGTNAFKKCSRCDLDFCSTCCMSECPMIALAEALQRLPQLHTLKIANCAFQGGRNGPVRSHKDVEGYRVLGAALSRHATLTHLDISKNYFRGPGFPYLARGVALMPALQTVKIGEEHLDFSHLLTTERIDSQESWLEAELLVLARAIARNSKLRYLELMGRHHLGVDVVIALVESLQGHEDKGLYTHIAPYNVNEGNFSNNSVMPTPTGPVRLEMLTVDGIVMPFGPLQRGEMSKLTFNGSVIGTDCSYLGPLFTLMVSVSKSLTDIDFSGLCFSGPSGPSANEQVTKGLVDSVLTLASGGVLQKYNGFPLHPARDLEVLDVQRKHVMSHGIFVLATTTIPNGNITTLNLSGCGMDVPSLSCLLAAMLRKQTVTSLDVSHHNLLRPGLPELANFLREDKKLQVLRARGVAPAGWLRHRPDEMIEFTKALDTNVTLSTLDLRENALHDSIIERLRRTMEEKRRVVPCPLHIKYVFLLCNAHLPYNMQLPGVLCSEVSTLFSDGAQSPLALIFQYCAIVRELILDDDSDSGSDGVVRARLRYQDAPNRIVWAEDSGSELMMTSDDDIEH